MVQKKSLKSLKNLLMLSNKKNYLELLKKKL